MTQSNDGSGTPSGENRATGNDDILMTYMGIGSRIDGLETVAASTAYNRAEIEAALKRQGLAPIGKGDVVILHSGWQEKPLSDPDSQKLVHPGLGVEGAKYLASLGVVAVGADTLALEVIPFENPNRPFGSTRPCSPRTGPTSSRTW